MKLAIIGSRGLWVEDMGAYLPPGVTELVSGGAKGIDTCAREYALSHGLKLTEFLPDYRRYGRAAPLVRNREIVAYADQVLAFWDGKSPGTKYVIDQCKKQKKTVTVHLLCSPRKRGNDGNLSHAHRQPAAAVFAHLHP